MKRITELFIKEQEQRIYSELPPKWRMRVSTSLRKGTPMSGIQNRFITSVADIDIDTFLTELLKTEEEALSSEAVSLSPEYFVGLTDEMVRLVERLYVTVRGIALREYPQVERDIIINQIGASLTSRIESIIVKVEMLQEKLKMQTTKATTGQTVFNITGDAGVINIGTIYGSVHSKLEKTINSKDDKLLEALNKILDEIKNSHINQNEIFMCTSHELRLQVTTPNS